MSQPTSADEPDTMFSSSSPGQTDKLNMTFTSSQSEPEIDSDDRPFFFALTERTEAQRMWDAEKAPIVLQCGPSTTTQPPTQESHVSETTPPTPDKDLRQRLAALHVELQATIRKSRASREFWTKQEVQKESAVYPVKNNEELKEDTKPHGAFAAPLGAYGRPFHRVGATPSCTHKQWKIASPGHCIPLYPGSSTDDNHSCAGGTGVQRIPAVLTCSDCTAQRVKWESVCVNEPRGIHPRADAAKEHRIVVPTANAIPKNGPFQGWSTARRVTYNQVWRRDPSGPGFFEDFETGFVDEDWFIANDDDWEEVDV